MRVELSDLESLISDTSKQVTGPTNRSLNSLVRWARKSVRQDKNDVPAILLLAARLLSESKSVEALKQLSEPTDAVTGRAMGHRIAAYALLMQSRVGEALTHFDAAIRLDPFLGDCWNMLGKISVESGKFESAEIYFERGSFADDPGHRCVTALARLQAKRKSLSKAIKTLQKSLERDQRSPVLNYELASMFSRRATVFLSRKMHSAHDIALRKASALMETTIAAAPTAKNHFFLGLIQKRLKHHEKSQESFERAAEIDPDSAMPITQIASLCVDNGQIDRAIELFEKSMKLDDTCAATHFRYTRAKKFKWNSETRIYADRLRRLVEKPDTNRHQEIQLCFALAKVLDDSGQHDEAWNFYDQANRLKTSHSEKNNSPQQSVLAQKERVEASINFFQRETIERLQIPKTRGVTPVFVVGMPRSGTTLTEQILSSHPSVYGAGELHQIGRIRHTLVDIFRSELQHDASPKAYPELLENIGAKRLVDVAAKHRSYLKGLCEPKLMLWTKCQLTLETLA